VLQLIKQPDNDVQLEASVALHPIVRGSPQACRVAADAGAVPALVACIGEGAGDDDDRMTALAPLFILVSGSTNRARTAAEAGAVPALCSLAGMPLTGEMVVHEALRQIVSACPPAPKVAAACARGLVRRLQQQLQRATAVGSRGGSRGGDPAQLAAALEVLLRNGSASSQEAAARAAAEVGRIGHTPYAYIRIYTPYVVESDRMYAHAKPYAVNRTYGFRPGLGAQFEMRAR
jgi:hypothetical protein